MTGRKNQRPEIRRDDARVLFFGLFTADERSMWTYPPGSYMDSLGSDISVLLADEIEPPEPTSIGATRPWDSSSRCSPDGHHIGPRPPQNSAPLDWMVDAACAAVDIRRCNLADPASEEEAANATQVCAACSVFDECRNFAIVTETSPTGVWADRASSNRFVNNLRRSTQERSDRTAEARSVRSANAEHRRIERRIERLRRELDLLEAQT